MNSPEHTQQKIMVKHVMTNSVVSIDSTATATDAAKMMEYVGVGAIVVLQNNSPVGIITDRYFTIKITAHSYPIDTLVKRIMSLL